LNNRKDLRPLGLTSEGPFFVLRVADLLRERWGRQHEGPAGAPRGTLEGRGGRVPGLCPIGEGQGTPGSPRPVIPVDDRRFLLWRLNRRHGIQVQIPTEWEGVEVPV
jgi:hypothetical protein